MKTRKGKRMKKIMFIGIALASIVACSDPKEAERVLEINGYKNIEITGYKPFACSEDDGFTTGFIAVSPNGTLTEGVVCSSWLGKGSTIRF